MDGQRPEDQSPDPVLLGQADAAPGPDAGAPAGSPEPSVDELVRREIEAEEIRSPRRPAPRGPQRRAWLLLLSALLGLGTAAVYFMQSAREPDKMELLRFVSLYLTFPLAMSVLMLFAYFSYPKK